MVSKKGDDLGGIKPIGDIGDLIPIRPKQKQHAKQFGYKVLRIEDGVYVSAIESRKEMQMNYGISLDVAKSNVTMAAKEAGFADEEILTAVKASEKELVDTTVEYSTPDGVQRLLIFDSIKNAKAFKKLLKNEVEIWLCEVTDPKMQKHLLLFPTPEDSVTFWDAMTSMVGFEIYKVIPRSMKLFLAPPGTMSVASLKLISKVE